MKITRFLMIACLLGSTANLAWASNDAYVCTLRVETGFTKLSETGFPQTTGMRTKAMLMTEPYCQGTSAGTVSVDSPVLQKIKKRKKVLEHMTKFRNVFQATLSSFQVMGIAAAQGAALNRATVVAINVEETPAKEFAFQATVPASTTKPAAKRATGKSGSTTSGYVCFVRNQYRMTDPTSMTTAQHIQTLEVQLFSKPFCLGKQIARHEYEFGPPMKKSRKLGDNLFNATANQAATSLMHAIYTTLVGAASAGQHVSIVHTPEGMIWSLELTARPRDLAKEIRTVAAPGK